MSDHEIFDKFSPNARKILISAQKIAQGMGTALGSEHILLALAITPKTLAQSILREQMVGLDQIRLIVSLQHFTKEPSPGMTREAKDALSAAAQVAADYGHEKIDSEHLLMGIISEDKFHATEVVDRIGTDPNTIIDQIRGFFEEMEDFQENPKDLPPDNSFNFQIPGAQPMDMPVFPGAPAKVNVESFTTDLTELAKLGKIDPVIGRDKEVDRVIQILGRRTKNNPVLVGEPGVGKTAIVEGLARRIQQGKVPSQFLNKKLIMLDLALLIAGTMYRGQFEERIKKVLDEIINRGDTLLFIDEIHTIIGAGSAEGSLDVANILKPALSKGKLRLIGATTFNEYRKFIEKDSALERRLQKITVNEPSEEETFQIIKGIKPAFEAHHGVKISDEAITAAVDLSVRYINDRFLPDKAIDLVDEAASAWQLGHPDLGTSELVLIKKELEKIRKDKEKEVEAENFAKAASLRTLEIKLEDKLKEIEKEKTANRDEIGREDIAKALSAWTNIPVEALKVEDKLKYANLATNMTKKIVGQSEAVEMVASAIKRSKTGLSEPNRPIGSFLFLGPTGVGKTELARILAEDLFGSKTHLIKIDMSEFMEHHNVSRLVGAPPGYVGFEDAGKLTEEVRQKPYSIILFDEIEKADAQVFNLLLQILEDGELTDAKGRKINFRNTIIILTSNIGMQEMNQQAAIGFKADLKQKDRDAEYEHIKSDVLKKVKDGFRPEFINRLDKIVVFKPLAETEILKITELKLKELALRLAKQDFEIKFSDQLVKFVANHGYEPTYGARPIRRAITDLIEAPLAEYILDNKFSVGDKIDLDVKKDQVVFTKLETRRKI